MSITASMVKELRAKTGAGIMDAKRTLQECDGDIEKASELLRQKGIASADKKSGRIAAEGIIASAVENGIGVIVEVNCETDFVAKNEDFKNLAQIVIKTIAEKNPANTDVLNNIEIDGKTIEISVKEAIATIGEKITIRRFERIEGNVATYIHNNKIGVLVETDAKDDVLAKDICLHIASSNCEYVSRDEIDQSIIDEETRIESGKEDLAKKPDNIKVKIVEGRVNKIMAQKCLLEQPFVKSPDKTIAQLIEGKFVIKRFVKYTLGEGLEKRTEDFAEEVKKQMEG